MDYRLTALAGVGLGLLFGWLALRWVLRSQPEERRPGLGELIYPAHHRESKLAARGPLPTLAQYRARMKERMRAAGPEAPPASKATASRDGEAEGSQAAGDDD